MRGRDGVQVGAGDQVVPPYVVLAKRWVVERTLAWNERTRRLTMHHDRLTTVTEAWVWLTETRMLLRRLTT